MPQMGFKHTIPVFERVNTFHAVDRAAIVIGYVDLQNFMLKYAILCYPYMFRGTSCIIA
jgi:hypothetical protein